MAQVSTVGIVGAGAAGLALAVMLRDSGFGVEVLERSSGDSALGSGITLQGNALRVLKEIGVWPQVLARGFPCDSVAIRAADPDATIVAVLDDVHTGGSDLPPTLGMYRPDLAAIVRARAEEAGAVLRYGTDVVALRQDESGVDVDAADGRRHRYDILIGADGINSVTRRMLGIDVVPVPTGAGAWRGLVTRPAEITGSELIYGGPYHIAGYCPIGPDSMYAYIVENAHERDPRRDWKVFRDQAGEYGGPWRAIAEEISEHTALHYTQFTTHFVQGDWHRGRVILVGDAAHSCPPTIAQGAAMALEDASVLAQELAADRVLDDAMMDRFYRRRRDRATLIVNSSVQLVRWMLDEDTTPDVPGVLHQVSEMVRVPA